VWTGKLLPTCQRR